MKAVYEFLELSAEKYPNKIAIKDDTASITYNELLKNSKFVSNSIKNMINHGQTISLLSENSINFVITYFGILMAGGIVHIIPPNSSEKQIEFQVQQVKPVIIVCSETLKNKINEKKRNNWNMTFLRLLMIACVFAHALAIICAWIRLLALAFCVRMVAVGLRFASSIAASLPCQVNPGGQKTQCRPETIGNLN